jgi:hypothetical protein
MDQQNQTQSTRAADRIRGNLQQKWEKYEKYAPASFFTSGFLFDVLTLDRIDSLFQIGQQFAFLALILVFLTYMLKDQMAPVIPPTNIFLRWLNPIWKYRVEAVHFLLGGLLSAYTLFFLKSASLLSSIVFLIIMTAILVGNEFSRVQTLSLGFKFGLLSFCYLIFLAYVVPIVTGFVGFGPFLIVVGLTAVTMFYIAHRYQKIGIDPTLVQRQVVRPTLIVLFSFVSLYALKVVPPIPLSAQYMGIFHRIERSPEGQYMAYYERPWWKFWQNGDQDFYARPGDKIHLFARVFSPVNFEDTIIAHWLLKTEKQGWITQDRIPFTIKGGRDQGFRGYTFKSNYQPGNWRVQLETDDGRELGRIYFTLETDDRTDDRVFRADFH